MQCSSRANLMQISTNLCSNRFSVSCQSMLTFQFDVNWKFRACQVRNGMGEARMVGSIERRVKQL